MLQREANHNKYPFFFTQVKSDPTTITIGLFNKKRLIVNNGMRWYCYDIEGSKMPPEESHCHPLATPQTPLLSRVSPNSRSKRILQQKYFRRRMMISIRKLIPLVVFILSTASIFRFLKITMNTDTSPPLPPLNQSECSSLSSICRKNISHQQDPWKDRSAYTNSSSVTEKEMRFLLEFFSRRVPCNLLIFGLEYQYSSIESLNPGGVTIFLEENLQNTSTVKSTNSKVYKIMYDTLASEAYKLLNDSRNRKDCLPNFHLPKVSKCNLVLSNLPQEVYETTWDVVMVDGPRGDTPDSPGKMATIYTASILARRGNMTHVIVHNVDRMIEKWFSWEFLCQENLVSSKGRFWHFQIQELPNATTFCMT